MRFVKRQPHLGYIDTHFHVPKDAVNVEGVKQALTFYIEDKMGDTRYLSLWSENDTHLIVPRAFWGPKQMDFETVDCRPRDFPTVDIRSHLILDAKNPLKTSQREAVDAILAAEGGILQLACGIGKTAVALHAASILKVPTLVIMNDNNLMRQWETEIKKHLDVPGGIGHIQGNICDWRKAIVLSTYQTMASRADDLPEELRRWFGFTIYEEGHHSSAPWFCRTIDITYGRRLILTATPVRQDGAHVVYNSHVGPVLFKDLRQELTPKFEFIWTGLKPDLANPAVKKELVDVTGELHLSKIASHLGRWPERLTKILSLVHQHEQAGRKILVLSNTVAELVNLLAMYNGEHSLYSDLLPHPPSFYHSSLSPIRITTQKRKRLELELKRAEVQLFDRSLPVDKKDIIRNKLIPYIETRLAQDTLAAKIEHGFEKHQRDYIKNLVLKPSGAGLMIAKVKPSVRMQMLKDKQTVFAIYRYGLEGLDNADLDTLIACEPMTGKNAIQQFVGRVLRPRPIKKEPLVQFLEDDIGPMIGMCKKVRHLLRSWPADEGGPYEYTLVNHPANNRNLTGGRRPTASAFPPEG